MDRLRSLVTVKYVRAFTVLQLERKNINMTHLSQVTHSVLINLKKAFTNTSNWRDTWTDELFKFGQKVYTRSVCKF